MDKKKLSLYEKLVFVAYGYYILLGLIWFTGSLVWGGFFNFWATATVLIFATQAWFRQKLTNLLLGILTFGLSVFMTLQFLWMGGKGGFNAFVSVMLTVCIVSLVMSVLLIFSYTKLSFKDQ